MQTRQETAILCGPGRSEASHPGGWILRPGHPLQRLIQAVTIVFAVISAAEFAGSPEI